MSDDFEELLKRWLRDRAGNDGSALEALAGNVAALPPRRRRRPSALLSLAASVLVVVGLAALTLSRQPGFGGAATATPAETTPGGATLPGGPERYTGDPRLAQCFGTADVQYVFEMVHARDYQRYLPRMLLAPELDVYDSAFVMVYRGEWQGPPMLGLPEGPRPPTRIPGRRFVCIVVAGGAPTLYTDVDITGLTVAVMPSETSGATASTAPTHAPPTPDVASPSPTVAPAPAWVADLAGQLRCDGAVANLGGEYPEGGSRPGLGDTAEAELAAFLGPGNPYASLPTSGFTQLHAEPHWASFGHLVDGHAKAIIILTDATEFGPGWAVVGLRACDASEFDPSVPLTFPVTIWTDTAGNRVSTETIRSGQGPGHCGWDSAIWLNVGGSLYFRDSQGVMGDWTRTKFEPHAQLPPSATDSGYRSGKWSLWLDPGKDAYLLSTGNVERWPRSLDPQIGCA